MPDIDRYRLAREQELAKLRESKEAEQRRRNCGLRAAFPYRMVYRWNARRQRLFHVCRLENRYMT